MSNVPKMTFEEAMNKSNPRQREAIEAIYGPVLVLAGPGTGKTQILSLRIGNILKQTDATPENILCLTYTDAGATAMRRRLRQLIGNAADGVTINTFHGFCSHLIQQGLIGDHEDRTREPMDDLDRFELLSDMLDELPADHPLRRLRSQPSFYVPHLTDLFSTMAREALSADDIKSNCDRHIADLPLQEEYIYKTSSKKYGYKAGDTKTKQLDAEIAKFEKTSAGAQLFDTYQEKKQELGRFDFDDMILSVLERLREDPALVLDLRERYQFILVDEYQDTSGAQNEVLYHLCGDAEDQPNVFVVGDDDQSIYRFQGANLDNIIEFSQRFNQGLTYVVLTDNYRCSPRILAGAKQLIEANDQRLINVLKGLDKDLQAAGANAAIHSGITAQGYADPTEEHLAITAYIQALLKDGVPAQEIAVIYPKHAMAEPLINYWQDIGVDYTMRRKENLLEQRVVRMMIDLLTAIHDGTQDGQPFDHGWYPVMLQPWFGISLEDAAQVSTAYRASRSEETGQRPHWLAFYKEHIQASTYSSKEALTTWLDCMETWTRMATQVPLMQLIDHLLYDGPIATFVHGQQHVYDDIHRLYSFFDFIKQRCMRDLDFDLSDLLDRLARLSSHRMKLDRQRGVNASQGVQMTTYHSAKGLEYDYVILMGSTQDKWASTRSGNRNFKLPPTLSSMRPDDDPQEKRRLFYVGVTRARKEVFITWSSQSTSGKGTQSVPFVDELIDGQPVDQYPYVMDATGHVRYLSTQMQPTPQLDEMPVEVVSDIVEQMQYSITAIDKYIRCPVAFYYENVLRAPQAPNPHMGFGNAVHEALERLFEPKKEGGDIAGADVLITYFEQSMRRHRTYFSAKTYEDHLALGHQLLTTYHNKLKDEWSQIPKVDTELRMRGTTEDGIPIVGVFDRVDDHGDHVRILDYKTGKASKAKAALRPPKPREEWAALWEAHDAEHDADKRYDIRQKIYGGSYWRQLVFYRLLAQVDGRLTKPLTRTTMSFIDAGDDDRNYAQDVDVTSEALGILRTHLKQVRDDISGLKFSQGCGRSNCTWCTMLSDRKGG